MSSLKKQLIMVVFSFIFALCLFAVCIAAALSGGRYENEVVTAKRTASIIASQEVEVEVLQPGLNSSLHSDLLFVIRSGNGEEVYQVPLQHQRMSDFSSLRDSYLYARKCNKVLRVRFTYEDTNQAHKIEDRNVLSYLRVSYRNFENKTQ